MELYITGITLEIPMGAVKADTMIELSIFDPSTTPKIEIEIGEAVLGHVVRIGPASVKFNAPAILSIPYSIADIPKYSSICIKYFDEDTAKWDRLPDTTGACS